MEETMINRLNKLFSLNISYEQKLILLALIEHSNPEGICPFAKDFFSDKLGISKWKLNRILSQLESMGHIGCIPPRKCYKLKF